MKKSILLSLVFVIIFAGITESLYGQKTELYVGIKGGMFLVDWGMGLYESPDNIYPIGGLLGYTFPLELENIEISIEGEFNYGIAGGNWEPFTPGDTAMQIDAEYDLWTGAGYGVLRFNMAQKAYLKAKIGIVYTNTNAKFALFGQKYDAGGDDTDLSLGVGLGFNVTDMIGIETEFTIIESSVNYLSFGVNLMPRHTTKISDN